MEYALRKAISEGKIDIKKIDYHNINEEQKRGFLEKGLLNLIENRSKESAAIILEYYIQAYGPLTDETAEKVKALMEDKK